MANIVPDTATNPLAQPLLLSSNPTNALYVDSIPTSIFQNNTDLLSSEITTNMAGAASTRRRSDVEAYTSQNEESLICLSQQDLNTQQQQQLPFQSNLAPNNLQYASFEEPVLVS